MALDTILNIDDRKADVFYRHIVKKSKKNFEAKTYHGNGVYTEEGEYPIRFIESGARFLVMPAIPEEEIDHE